MLYQYPLFVSGVLYTLGNMIFSLLCLNDYCPRKRRLSFSGALEAVCHYVSAYMDTIPFDRGSPNIACKMVSIISRTRSKMEVMGS